MREDDGRPRRRRRARRSAPRDGRRVPSDHESLALTKLLTIRANRSGCVTQTRDVRFAPSSDTARPAESDRRTRRVDSTGTTRSSRGSPVMTSVGAVTCTASRAKSVCCLKSLIRRAISPGSIGDASARRDVARCEPEPRRPVGQRFVDFGAQPIDRRRAEGRRPTTTAARCSVPDAGSASRTARDGRPARAPTRGRDTRRVARRDGAAERDPAERHPIEAGAVEHLVDLPGEHVEAKCWRPYVDPIRSRRRASS